MPTAARALLLPTALLTLPLTACGAFESNDPATSDEGPVTVSSTDETCELSGTEAPSGRLAFDVTNDGSQVTEFYLLGEDGQRILGEVENIGPGLTRQLVVSAPPGSYTTACKPGMTGEGIRAAFTVTDSGADITPTGEDAELVDQAVANYQSYVEDQSDQLLAKTEEFVAALGDGDDDQARALYPVARTHWERIETVAESFGDLDPKMDAREADLEPGQRWTGWHRLEKDLWPERAEDYTPLSETKRDQLAQQLLTDTETLQGRITELDITLDQIANGSRGLLEEVASGKVTGEEEYWSRTDLYDFQANVDGARVAFEGVEPLLRTKDADLADELGTRFDDLQALLEEHQTGEETDGVTGYVDYDELDRDEVKQLADAVNALSEPLSRLTGTLLT